MSYRLEGKAAMVTGAGDGIGQGIALRLTAEGAAVVVAEFNEDTGRGTIDRITEAGQRAILFRCDVTNRSETRASWPPAWGLSVPSISWSTRPTAGKVPAASRRWRTSVLSTSSV